MNPRCRHLLPAALAALGALPLVVAASTAPAAPEVVERHGLVRAWHVDMHGIVALQLEEAAAGADGPRRAWYRTPPDRSAQVRVEELVLDVLLSAGDRELTVQAQAERGLTGEDPEEALPLVSVSWRRQ